MMIYDDDADDDAGDGDDGDDDDDDPYDKSHSWGVWACHTVRTYITLSIATAIWSQPPSVLLYSSSQYIPTVL